MILQLTLQQQLYQLSSINLVHKQLSYGTEPAPGIRAEFLCGRLQMGCVQRTLCIFVHSYIIWRAFLLLGACIQFQKTKISFKISVCLHGKTQLPLMNIHVDLHLKNFGKSIEEIQVISKYYKNNEYFIWRRMYIYDNISLNSF